MREPFLGNTRYLHNKSFGFREKKYWRDINNCDFNHFIFLNNFFLFLSYSPLTLVSKQFFFQPFNLSLNLFSVSYHFLQLSLKGDKKLNKQTCQFIKIINSKSFETIWVAFENVNWKRNIFLSMGVKGVGGGWGME